DAIVIIVGNVETAIQSDRHITREAYPGSQCQAAVTTAALAAVPSDGGDDPVRPDPPDDVLASTGNVEATVRSDRNTLWIDQPCQGRGAAIAICGEGIASSKGADDPIGRAPPDALVSRVGDVQAAVRPNCHIARFVQCSSGSRATITAEASLVLPRD